MDQHLCEWDAVGWSHEDWLPQALQLHSRQQSEQWVSSVLFLTCHMALCMVKSKKTTTTGTVWCNFILSRLLCWHVLRLLFCGVVKQTWSESHETQSLRWIMFECCRMKLWITLAWRQESRWINARVDEKVHFSSCSAVCNRTAAFVLLSSLHRHYLWEYIVCAVDYWGLRCKESVMCKLSV